MDKSREDEKRFFKRLIEEEIKIARRRAGIRFVAWIFGSTIFFSLLMAFFKWIGG